MVCRSWDRGSRDGRRHVVASARTSTSRACCPSPPSATGCRASCASTASASSCVNAAGNPLAPAAAARAEAQAALRGAIELAALLGVDTVVTMSGCPGGRGAGDSTGVFAVSWLCCDDEPLWEWQFREHVVPFWRELSAWAGDRCSRAAHLPRAASRADDLRSRQLRAPARRGRPQHRHQPRPEPLLVAGRRPARDRRAHGDAIGFAHGKDTLLHPERIRLQRPARRPLPDRPGHGLVALRRRRRRAAHSRSGGTCSPPCAAPATTASSRSSTRIPTLSPEASIEASAVALREALAWQ